jgi:hypothetical protein
MKHHDFVLTGLVQPPRLAELEKVRGALPAGDLVERVLRLADLRRRALQLGTQLTAVEVMLSSILGFTGA